MRAKITKRTVDGLQPGERDAFLWDTELPGFGCKITPKGSRIYILQYGRSGRDHRVTIGRHGIDVTPEQARLEAQRLRGPVAAGETPSAAREKRSENINVAELGQRYLDEYAIPPQEAVWHRPRSSQSRKPRDTAGRQAAGEVDRADRCRAGNARSRPRHDGKGRENQAARQTHSPRRRDRREPSAGASFKNVRARRGLETPSGREQPLPGRQAIRRAQSGAVPLQR